MGLGFLGLGKDESASDHPRYSVIPVPYDGTVTYVAGTRRGPEAIIKASEQVELYDEELDTEPYKAGVETLKPLDLDGLGPEDAVDRVRAASAEVVSTGRVPVVLGGEHSISAGTVRALLRKYPDLSVLQLDAHADLRDSYTGTRSSHACTARRISELCPLVQVGVRSLSIEEREFLVNKDRVEGRPIKTFYAAEVLSEGFVWDKVMDELTSDVYVTIDLDVFDPSIMAAVGTPEPGGLGWYETLALLRGVASAKTVVGFDVVELCPIDGNVAPDFTAARLVYKMMGYINEGSPI